jgi:hypothetical protein
LVVANQTRDLDGKGHINVRRSKERQMNAVVKEIVEQPRVLMLPKKVSMALSSLTIKKLIDPELVDVLVMASQLVKQHDKLLGFAIVALTLQKRGVPLFDTVRMAHQLDRRIKLDWSEQRWRDEHEALSRLSTLRQLAAERVVYDLSDVERLLPKKFNGYLIRTSRRLGMEGLRQRHCVASYHDTVRNGHSALLSMFVDRQRWTVEVRKRRDSTGSAAESLYIAQAKGRLNRPPTASQLELIYRNLGIEMKKSEPEAQHVRRQYFYKEGLQQVLPVLRARGAKTVAVSFDGGGDSGCVDGAVVRPSEVDLEETIAWEVIKSEWNGQRFETVRVTEEVTLADAIHQIAENYLESSDVDWYNGDGGFGEFIINVVEGTVSMEVNVRRSDSECMFNQTLDIQTGDRID